MKFFENFRFVIISAAALCALSGSAGQAPDFSIRVSDGAKVVATPPAGFHINVKAPIFLTTNGKQLKPVAKSEHEATFDPGAAAAKFSVTLFLCDDGNKICEKHTVSQGGAGNEVSKPSAGDPFKTQPFPGFIVNDPDRALALARRTHKPLLIDFFGIWCPPCNELDELVFSKRDFLMGTSGFVRLKLDADAPVSWALKSKYKVSGYPTVVFATSAGDEISRLVGYRDRDAFLAEAHQAWNERATGFGALLKRADSDDRDAADRVGLTYLERHDFARADTYLKGTSKYRERWHEARIGALDDARKAGSGNSDGSPSAKYAESSAAVIGALETSITEFPATPGSIDRRMQLADLYEAAGRKSDRESVLRTAVQRALAIIAAPKVLQGMEATPADLWSQVADARTALGDEAGAREAWKAAAAEYRTSIAAMQAHGAGARSASDERGYNLELAYCLWKSGDTAGAEGLYSSLEKRYPDEFTFHYAHARMKLDLGDAGAAKTLATRAFEHSYGDNRLRAAHLLAQALDRSGDAAGARRVIHETLTGAKLPDDSTIRTHRYAQALRDFEKKIQK